MNASELLNAAADYIEKHGWQQGELGHVGGPVCILGSLIYADGSSNSRAIDQSVTLIRDRIGGGKLSVAAWNDHPDRTLKDVLRTLRLAAIRI
jgi:hypothetical protein